jgi:hypothetical protein
MDMLKLMMDKEFREAAQKVGSASDIILLYLFWRSVLMSNVTQLTEEMQNAGVEINPDVRPLQPAINQRDILLLT